MAPEIPTAIVCYGFSMPNHPLPPLLAVFVADWLAIMAKQFLWHKRWEVVAFTRQGSIRITSLCLAQTAKPGERRYRSVFMLTCIGLDGLKTSSKNLEKSLYEGRIINILSD